MEVMVFLYEMARVICGTPFPSMVLPIPGILRILQSRKDSK